MTIEADVRENPWGVVAPAEHEDWSVTQQQAAGAIGGGLGADPHARLHNLLSVDHPDTLAGTVVAGDIVTGNSTPKWARLAKGAAGTFLKAGASVLSWVAVAFTDLTGSLQAGQHGSLADGDHTGTLSGNARVAVRKNSGGSDVTRRRINLIEGSRITVTLADDSGNEEADVTIAAGPAVLYLMSNSYSTQLAADTTTRYLPPSGPAAPTTTESDHFMIATAGMNITAARGRLNDGAPGVGNTRTLTLMKNGVATSVVLSFGAADSVATWSGSVSFNAGDLLSWRSEATGTPVASKIELGLRGEET